MIGISTNSSKWIGKCARSVFSIRFHPPRFSFHSLPLGHLIRKPSMASKYEAKYFVGLRLQEVPTCHITICFLGAIEKKKFPEIIEQMKLLEPFLPSNVILDGQDKFGRNHNVDVRLCHFENEEFFERVKALHASYGETEDHGLSLHITTGPDRDGIVNSSTQLTAHRIYLKQVGKNNLFYESHPNLN